MRNLWMILACFAGLIVFTGLLIKPENLIAIVVGYGLLAVSNRIKLKMTADKKNQSWLNLILVAIGCFLIFIGVVTLPYISSILLAMMIVGLIYYAIVRDKSENDHHDLTLRQTKIVAAEDGAFQDQEKVAFLKFDYLFNNGPYKEAVYAWEDVEIYHLYANTFIDFGSTIVPVGTNVVVINQLIGQTKLVVPEGVGLELHVNGFRTEVNWNGEKVALNNERKTFESASYQQSNRKIYLQVSQGWGTVEVVFL
ncbi:cell wall-active antibiotics response protein LiaF [Aerococcus sp. NPDC058936]|uniref:cell wall-active antibiotics response protein LiaF n=1 Tax=Aerococcus sp. NPDC058936 TaxID=3346674 RepID=UPI00367274C4